MLRRKDEMTSVKKPNLRGGEGVIDAYELLRPCDLSGKANLCAIMTVEPGCSIGEHAHQPDAEIYYMLEGELRVWDNGKETVFHPGDVMFTANGDTHAVRNDSDAPAKMLAIVIA
ncbi:cupin domain-containing protein [Acidaminobacterium chupaoyuni]